MLSDTLEADIRDHVEAMVNIGWGRTRIHLFFYQSKGRMFPQGKLSEVQLMVSRLLGPIAEVTSMKGPCNVYWKEKHVPRNLSNDGQ